VITIAQLRSACSMLAKRFSPPTCCGAFPVIEVTEIGNDVILTARRWSEAYPSPAAAMAALPMWGARFNRSDGEVRKALEGEVHDA